MMSCIYSHTLTCLPIYILATATVLNYWLSDCICARCLCGVPSRRHVSQLSQYEQLDSQLASNSTSSQLHVHVVAREFLKQICKIRRLRQTIAIQLHNYIGSYIIEVLSFIGCTLVLLMSTQLLSHKSIAYLHSVDSWMIQNCTGKIQCNCIYVRHLNVMNVNIITILWPRAIRQIIEK